MLTKVKVQLFGRTGKPAEMKYVPKGDAKTTFSVAVDQGKGDDKVTIWYNCEAWGKYAETIGTLLKTQGRLVYVEGLLTQDSWMDKNSGERRTAWKVKVSDLQVLDNKPDQAAAPADEDDEEIIPISAA